MIYLYRAKMDSFWREDDNPVIFTPPEDHISARLE